MSEKNLSHASMTLHRNNIEGMLILIVVLGITEIVAALIVQEWMRG